MGVVNLPIFLKIPKVYLSRLRALRAHLPTYTHYTPYTVHVKKDNASYRPLLTGSRLLISEELLWALRGSVAGRGGVKAELARQRSQTIVMDE